MQRPAAACQALGIGPLVKAMGADAAGIESVPGVPAAAHPKVVGRRGPATQGTATFSSASASRAGFDFRDRARPILDRGPLVHHGCARLPAHTRLTPMRK